MATLIMNSLKSYSMSWNHLEGSLDFEALRALLGIEVHKLRNIHDLEIYRAAGGIFARFKQYMSDTTWSRPRLVIGSEQVPIVAQAVPKPILHQFSASHKQKFADFLTKFELLLQSTNMLNEDEKEGIKWLRDANSRDTGYKMDILKIINDIESVHNG